jgi:hypothetical protein
MRPTFGHVYRKLPICKELVRIQEALGSLVSVQQQQWQLQQQQRQLEIDAYRRQLLSEDRYRNCKRLNRYEMQVFSQNGEDGILAEIFRRIGVRSRTFVEIGVGDGLENNTAFLLLQGWRGCWIEGDENSIKVIRQRFRRPLAEGRLMAIHTFVTAEHIEGVLQQWPPPDELDLLSLDIDRNTYWIWASLMSLRPRVVVVEYNAMFPPELDWKVEYDAGRSWNGTAYFGASLKAYELLAKKRGYHLVGCDLHGVNAFFVRQDLCEDRFEEPFTSEHHYEPFRLFLIQRSGHTSCFGDEV